MWCSDVGAPLTLGLSQVCEVGLTYDGRAQHLSKFERFVRTIRYYVARVVVLVCDRTY